MCAIDSFECFQYALDDAVDVSFWHWSVALTRFVVISTAVLGKRRSFENREHSVWSRDVAAQSGRSASVSLSSSQSSSDTQEVILS